MEWSLVTQKTALSTNGCNMGQLLLYLHNMYIYMLYNGIMMPHGSWSCLQRVSCDMMCIINHKPKNENVRHAET